MSASPQALNTYHPISLYQRLMIETAVRHPPEFIGNLQKIIRLAFRVRPGVPVRTLRRAFDKLVARHDSLRLRFVEVAGDWKAEIRPNHPHGLLVEDLRHLTPTEQETVIRERADQPMSALSPALFEMYLMQCGNGGDVVIMRLQHGIGDGYSAAILLEELMKAVLMMPLGPKPPGHAEFMRIREKGEAHRGQEKDKYWQSKLLPPPKDLNIGRTAKGLPQQSIQTMGDTRRLDHFMSAAHFTRLEMLSKKTGVSPYCYLLAAFAEMICAMGSGTEVLLSSMVGRSDKALAGFVGAEAQYLDTRYSVDPTDLAGRAAWFSQQLTEGAEHLPSRVFGNPDHQIAQSYKDAGRSLMRFGGNVITPSGKFANSPFKGIFGEAMTGTAFFGSVSFEQVHLPKRSETAYELIIVLNKLDTGLTASLVADKLGYSEPELAEIGEGICHRVEECFEKQRIAQ